MSDITVSPETIVVDENNTNSSVTAINTNENVEVLVESSATIEVAPYEYHLTSSGIYTGNLTGDVPTWLVNAINTYITTGTGNLNDTIIALTDRVSTAEAGIAQNVVSISNTDANLNALSTTVTSRLDTNEASILDLQTTKVDSGQATALATNVLQSVFGTDAAAYINSLIVTYASTNLATATDYSTISATVNSHSASVTRLDEAVVDTTRDNPLWVDDGIQTDPDIYGQPRYIISARAKASLEVNVDGNISGYVASTDGSVSTFEILADTFKVSNGATKLTVFTVDTVNNLVGFNANMVINGDISSVENIHAENIKANTIWTDGTIKSTNYSWGAGTPTGFGMWATGDPDSGQSYNIIGSSIYGGSIYGALLESSTMKIRDLKVVTDGGYDTASIITKSITGASGVINTGIYAYNATDAGAGTSRLSTATATVMMALGVQLITYNYSDGLGNFLTSSMGYYGRPIITRINNGFTPTVTVKRGTTTLGSSAISAGTSWSVAGLTFTHLQPIGYSSIDGCLFMSASSTPDLSGDGELIIEVTNATTFYNFNLLAFNMI